MISIKDVEQIAKLARLCLSEAEKKKYSKELSGILDYMKKLNEADTKNIEPTAQAPYLRTSEGQVSGLTNVFRKDELPHEVEPEKVKKVVGQAPEREGNFVKTKPILGNSSTGSP